MSSFPTTQQPDFCTSIVANPDLSGRGIRVSIYLGAVISLILSALVSPRRIRTLGEGSRYTLITSTALTISAIIAWKTNGFSLFDGLIVTMLTSLMASWVVYNIGFLQYLGFTINFSGLLYFASTTYWGFQVWLNPTFGLPLNGENCTANLDTIIVVLGMDISPSNRSLRAFALFYFGLGALGALWSLMNSIIWLTHYAGYIYIVDVTPTLFSWEDFAGFSKGMILSLKLITVLPALGWTIYMIVTIEQMVERNSVQDQLSNWTYGQTLSMLVLLQQIMTFFSVIKREDWIW
ncbi:unnamed protein product [Rhizoctonia solani]|uniref:Uncharacterized protein n=1 Tax=Rhizoctonia solani TaxID=456999 RepID=A0A8H3B1U3_9AGAM|nr:unnamed protein product [Rhizoctonia solani]